MASFPGRSGRRRRVLNEEVLAASASHLALRAAPDDFSHSAATSRYGAAASVENHPHISDLVPRRHRSIAFLLVFGAAITAVVSALSQLELPFFMGRDGVAPLDLNAGGSVAAWMGAMVAFAAAVNCALIYSIRRHRLDDIRGRYRIWRWASLACLAVSANNVAGLNVLVEALVAHATGWSSTGGAIGASALIGLPLVWIAIRAFLDAKECIAAVLLQSAAAAAYGAAVIGSLGLLPAAVADWRPLVTGAGALLGHWLLLAATVSYARHVIIDAQSLPADSESPAKRRRDVTANNRQSVGEASIPETDQPSRPAPKLRVHAGEGATERSALALTSAKSTARPQEWVDGSRRERDRYEVADDDMDAAAGDHKLSKAERKQMRKLKARNRAA